MLLWEQKGRELEAQSREETSLEPKAPRYPGVPGAWVAPYKDRGASGPIAQEEQGHSGFGRVCPTQPGGPAAASAPGAWLRILNLWELLAQHRCFVW